MNANSELLDCAVAAARAAGDHALANWGRRTEIIQLAAHDVKLRLDVECQEQAEAVIHGAFPGHAILGEEGAAAGRAGGAEVEWIVDPIDGTVNFSHGLRRWCCSIACRSRGELLAGVVYAPALDEFFTGARGEPSRLNGSPIQVSDIDDLARGIVMTGMDKSLRPDLRPYAVFESIAARSLKARIMGAAALDICHVACGRADGYFEAGIYIWDIAAAWLIVEGAGGRGEALTEPDDSYRMSFVATNGLIHDSLKQAVVEAQ